MSKRKTKRPARPRKDKLVEVRGHLLPLATYRRFEIIREACAVKQL